MRSERASLPLGQRLRRVRRRVLPRLRGSTPQHAFRLFQDQLTNHLTADFHAQLAPIRGGRSGFGQ